jgi:hypothetical protein
MNTKTRTQTVEREIEMPNPEPIPTAGSIAEAVMNTELKHVNQTMSRIESKFDEAIKSFATKERVDAIVETNAVKNAEQDLAIKKLEDWNTWFMRTAGALLIAAIVSGVLITK